MKTCKKCKQEKGITEFSKDKKQRDGLDPWCKVCKYAYNSSWKKDNPDKNSAHVKKWQKANPEIASAKSKEWQKANPEKCYARMVAWQKANPEKNAAHGRKYRKNNADKVNARNAKKRANKLKATPKWLTKDQLKQIESFYTLAKKLTKETGIKHHVDHIVPLQGKNVKGLHVPWNLQVITQTENILKGNRVIL